MAIPSTASAQQREPIGNDTPGQVHELAVATCNYYADYGYSTYDLCFNEIVNLWPYGQGSSTEADFAFCAAFRAQFPGSFCFV